MLPEYWDIDFTPNRNPKFDLKKNYVINENGQKLALEMLKDFKLRF